MTFFFFFLRTGMRVAGIVFPTLCYKCMYPNGSSATKFCFILCSAATTEDSAEQPTMKVDFFGVALQIKSEKEQDCAGYQELCSIDNQVARRR